METKFICMLLLLLQAYVGTASLLAETVKPKRTITTTNKEGTRMPVEFDFTATETNDVLQISFIGSLNDADIIVTDCQGNMVWQEYQTLIYTGDGILISDAKNYPYRINITSPTMDVLGEIDKE